MIDFTTFPKDVSFPTTCNLYFEKHRDDFAAKLSGIVTSSLGMGMGFAAISMFRDLQRSPRMKHFVCTGILLGFFDRTSRIAARTIFDSYQVQNYRACLRLEQVNWIKT